MIEKKLIILMIVALSLSCAPMDTTNHSANAPAIQPGDKAASRETGRAFLIKGQDESPGYGLYSYVLFGSPPNDATRERYLQTVSAYLSIPQALELRHYRPSCELNVTYLPLTERAGDDPKADWLLDHYDYTRARILLQAIGGKRRDGPYIISTYKPLGGVQRLSGQYLYQDLSSTPPEIVTLWMKEFLNQAEQQRFWEERALIQCALRLREGVAVAAKGFPDVEQAVATVVSRWVP